MGVYGKAQYIVVSCNLKTRLGICLADCNLFRLMRIAIKGPEMQSVNFNDTFYIHGF